MNMPLSFSQISTKISQYIFYIPALQNGYSRSKFFCEQTPQLPQMETPPLFPNLWNETCGHNAKQTNS